MIGGRNVALFLVGLWLIGCGGQVGEERIDICDVGAGEAASRPDADEVISTVSGSRSAGIAWVDDKASTLNLDVDYDEGGIRPCGDSIAIELVVKADTEDGRLNEVWMVEAIADAAGTVRFTHRLDELAGTLDFPSFAPTGAWESVHGWIELALANDAATGRLMGEAAANVGDVALADSFPVAYVGTAPP